MNDTGTFLKMTLIAQEILPKINKWDHLKLNEPQSKRNDYQSENTAYRMEEIFFFGYISEG